MLTIRRVLDGRVERLDPAEATDVIHQPTGLVWVDLVEPVDDESGFLRTLGLHHLVVDDLIEEELHPKLDVYPDYLFLVAHGVDPDSNAATFETLELDVVVGAHCLITHAAKRLPAVESVATELERNPALGASTDRLLYEVLDAVVDRFIDLFEAVDDHIDGVEDQLFAERPDVAVRNTIYRLRRTVVRLQRIARPQASTVGKLATHAGDVDGGGDHADKMERLYRDIADKFDRIANLADSYRGQLDGALDQYQTAVANAQNEIMKVLTMVSVVLLPITVVAGIYGMNFTYMPELDERWGYPAVWVAIVAIVVGVLTVFRRRGWLGSGRRLGDSDAGGEQAKTR